LRGIGSPGAKAVLVSSKGIAGPPFSGAADGAAAGVGVGASGTEGGDFLFIAGTPKLSFPTGQDF